MSRRHRGCGPHDRGRDRRPRCRAHVHGGSVTSCSNGGRPEDQEVIGLRVRGKVTGNKIGGSQSGLYYNLVKAVSWVVVFLAFWLRLYMMEG